MAPGNGRRKAALILHEYGRYSYDESSAINIIRGPRREKDDAIGRGKGDSQKLYNLRSA